MLLFGLDINNLAEYKSSAFIYKFIFGKPGRTQQLFPHFGKPYRKVQAGFYKSCGFFLQSFYSINSRQFFG
jgi:hypothetical protein